MPTLPAGSRRSQDGLLWVAAIEGAKADGFGDMGGGNGVGGGEISDGAGKKLNAVLPTIGRELFYENGLPKREWYRNMIYAAGYYTGLRRQDPARHS